MKLYTEGMPRLGVFTGAEIMVAETDFPAGINPGEVAVTTQALAIALKSLNQSASHATVAGTRYYGSFTVNPGSVLTGLSVLVGATGGTDNWIVELHDSTGAIVATSALAGTLAGTANTFQRIPFTAAYTIPPIPPGGSTTYYLVLQSNGTTATYGAYASPGLLMTSGSAAGTFGTSAAITPPTTYTANLAPQMLPY